MSGPWLHVVGIGADGLPSLSPAARAALEGAVTIIGGTRHHALTAALEGAERISWPSPFDALIFELTARRGTPTVVLATGDPLWFSVGSQLADRFSPEELCFHPQLSSFQLAASRLAWSLEDVECLSLHGRPVETLRARLYPGARFLMLTGGSETPRDVAALLSDCGMGAAQMTVLSDLGAKEEAGLSATAEAYSLNAPAFHVLAVECPSCVHGPLEDSAFAQDGTMTKSDVRAITMAQLAPYPGALLWDVGAGCGSISVAWMRAARRARAIAVEPREDRRTYCQTNSTELGVPALEIVAGSAPDALTDLPQPDAIFIGGGLSMESADLCIEKLRAGGRLVANAVTLESEAVLRSLYASHGGTLSRIGIERVSPVGERAGWRPAMTVTQWTWVKT